MNTPQRQPPLPLPPRPCAQSELDKIIPAAEYGLYIASFPQAVCAVQFRNSEADLAGVLWDTLQKSPAVMNPAQLDRAGMVVTNIRA